MGTETYSAKTQPILLAPDKAGRKHVHISSSVALSYCLWKRALHWSSASKRQPLWYVEYMVKKN
jgi:hypothetical protein